MSLGEHMTFEEGIVQELVEGGMFRLLLEEAGLHFCLMARVQRRAEELVALRCLPSL